MKTLSRIAMVSVLGVWILGRSKLDISNELHTCLTISLLGITIMVLVLTHDEKC
jgi:hypothetical protein